MNVGRIAFGPGAVVPLHASDRATHGTAVSSVRGKLRCPWHDEATPSCVYTAYQHHCFGCGHSGSLDDLVARLTDIGRIEDAAYARG